MDFAFCGRTAPQALRHSLIYARLDSARSGVISGDQFTQMEVWVQGEGSVSFYWKGSSEDSFDWLEFYVDGVRQDRISGEVDWTQKTYSITGTGTHSLLWQYTKDSGGDSGDDSGWVDYLQWTPSSGSSAPAWETVEYTYDPSGRRIAKTFDGVLTNQYVYDGDNMIAEYDGDGTLVRKYIQGARIDQPVSMIDVEDSNAVYYYHYDALGSVVALSNVSGTTVEVYEYSAFGEVAATDANNPNPFTFTGREFDKETGLYFYRARYYAPEIGRFLQTDPIGYAGGMDFYWYCMNNPCTLTDPFGRYPGDDKVEVIPGSPCEYWEGEYNRAVDANHYSTAGLGESVGKLVFLAINLKYAQVTVADAAADCEFWAITSAAICLETPAACPWAMKQLDKAYLWLAGAMIVLAAAEEAWAWEFYKYGRWIWHDIAHRIHLYRAAVSLNSCRKQYHQSLIALPPDPGCRDGYPCI